LDLKFSGCDVTSGGVFAFFGHIYPALGAIPKKHFLAKVFFAIRPKSAHSEPLMDVLAYLESKSWEKSQNLVKPSAPTNANLGWITSIFYMAITRQQIELESCRNLL